ncbi:MAG: septum formation initiator family protein [Christensenellaceae bacterium]
MNELKLKQILGSFVAAAVVLMSILVSIAVYQGVLCLRTDQNIKRLERRIEELEEEKQQTENEIEIWMQDWKIDEIARELGYFYGDDKK